MSAEPDVYLMAFACEPGRGSEPGVGFAFAQAAARLAGDRGRRIVLVTRPHRVDAIRAALGDDAAHLEIMAVPLPRPLVALTGRLRVRYAYVPWQLRAALRVRRAVEARGVDAVVHHITFATEALPTFERLTGPRASLVFGPAGSATLGGGTALRVQRALRSAVARLNLSGADLLVAQNEHVARSWDRFAAEVVVESNIVVEPSTEPQRPVEWDVACVGYLVERKRVDLAITAFAASAATGRMVVVGDGPELARLRAVAADAGIADRVDFPGAASRTEVMAHLSRSRLLLHPSRQEGAGWVVGEAQAVGCTPVVFAGSGADTPVRAAGLGIVVDPDAPEGLRDAIDAGLAAPRPRPSDRWSAERLPLLLDDWYARAGKRVRSGAT